MLVIDQTRTPNANKVGQFYITSNWSDVHDAVNYLYFDEVEIFSDTGTGGSGSMSAGTMTQGGGDTTPPAAPTGLGVQ